MWLKKHKEMLTERTALITAGWKGMALNLTTKPIPVPFLPPSNSSSLPQQMCTLFHSVPGPGDVKMTQTRACSSGAQRHTGPVHQTDSRCCDRGERRRMDGCGVPRRRSRMKRLTCIAAPHSLHMDQKRSAFALFFSLGNREQGRLCAYF